ncbi:MAG: DUF2917 domain-containing protein [Burkholderiaceae bacterium]|nr:DUF2917 domain-containing protein [Burkholderiaceae bacterium]
MFKIVNRRLIGLVSNFWPNTGAPGVEKVTVKLPPHGWLSIAQSRGVTIECVSGEAVVTQEGDAREHLLVRGHPYRARRHEHLYVQANTDAELHLASLMLGSKCV